MPLPWKSSSSSNRHRSTTAHAHAHAHHFLSLDHPDLPSSAAASASPSPSPRPAALHRSSSVSDRISSARASDRARDRSSIAVLPATHESSAAGPTELTAPSNPNSALPSPNFSAQSSPTFVPAGLRRSQTVLRREGPHGSSDISPVLGQEGAPSQLWSFGLGQLPPAFAQQEQQGFVIEAPPTMSNQRTASTASKASSDSGTGGMDAWSKRRLNRLNTEHVFREQRQGGQPILSPPPPSEPAPYNNNGSNNTLGIQYGSDTQAQPQHQQQPQPQPSPYQAQRTGPTAPSGAPLSLHTQPVSNSRSPNYSHVQELPSSNTQSYSPPDNSSHYSTQDYSRPDLQHSRSYTTTGTTDSNSMSASNNGNIQAPKPLRTGNNRQSVHNGMTPRDASGLNSAQPGGQQQQGGLTFNASIIPPASQGTPARGDNGPGQQQGDARRATPQPAQAGEDMTDEDVNQLIKDHKELREKYTKVKKYYFEKEDQVKQLQNSLAHQRLSQSRTSLDDSEYTTRFNRLDGLIAQLAFSIRKSWRSIPSWLVASVNKDAVQTGKQEMTAAGRAFISCWLVEEVFDKYFHPDLESSMSLQLKSVQRNIRRFAPPSQTAEEEEFLTSKVVNWRLSTLEGLAELLRSPQCAQNRAQLTDMLKEHLIGALAVHLQDPPPSDLEGGVHMIVELVVSIAIHIPVESRDVVIEYFMPGHGIMLDLMKVETGIPPLTISIADDAADRASMKSSASDVTDMTDPNSNEQNHQPRRRGMLSALTGATTSNKPKVPQGGSARAAGAGGSSSSLNRPESQGGPKDDMPPRVRMAAGIGVSVRGRSVLVKAPIFST